MGKLECPPPVSRLTQPEIGEVDISAVDEADEPGPALVAQASAGPVPAHHHILPLIEPRHELQALTVHHSTAADSDVARVLRQHHVPLVLLFRVVLESRAAHERRSFLDVQNDAGFEADRGSQVGAPRREGDVAGGEGGAAVDGRLDGGGVVVDAVSSGAEVDDGDGGGGEGVREFDGG